MRKLMKHFLGVLDGFWQVNKLLEHNSYCIQFLHFLFYLYRFPCFLKKFNIFKSLDITQWFYMWFYMYSQTGSKKNGPKIPLPLNIFSSRLYDMKIMILASPCPILGSLVAFFVQLAIISLKRVDFVIGKNKL